MYIFHYLYVYLYQNNKQIEIMKAIDVQKNMSKAYANNSYKKAFTLFTKMNELRKEEGLDYLTLPNLQKRFNCNKTSH